MASEATAIGVGASPGELELVVRLQRADQAAYAEFCRLFGPSLHGYVAIRLDGDDELAEEVVVQSLADAVRNIRRFNPRKAALASWVYGIARRQVVGERRRLNRRKSVPPSAQVPIEEALDLAEAGDMASDLISRVDARRKAACLSQVLSDLELEVLVLHCVDEFSLREIGGIVGRSEKAVDSVLHRARQKARERLARDGE